MYFRCYFVVSIWFYPLVLFFSRLPLALPLFRDWYIPLVSLFEVRFITFAAVQGFFFFVFVSCFFSPSIVSLFGSFAPPGVFFFLSFFFGCFSSFFFFPCVLSLFSSLPPPLFLPPPFFPELANLFAV